MTSDRRVSDLNAAELLEAAASRLSGLGVRSGRWHLELELEDGRVRRLKLQPLPGGWCAVTLGRDKLAEKEAA